MPSGVHANPGQQSADVRLFFYSPAAHLLLKKPKARTLKVFSTLTDLLTAPSLDVL
jgi:hypothetical protein